LFLFILFLSSFLISRNVYAKERATAIVTEIESPTLKQENDRYFYQQRVLLTITSGIFKNTEEETTYTFPRSTMARALNVGDQVVVEIDPENTYQRVDIVDFNRSRQLFFIPLILLFLLGAIIGISQVESIATVIGSIVIPALVILCYKVLSWPPILVFALSSFIIATLIFLLKFKRQITFYTAISSFLISTTLIGIGLYAIVRSLDTAAGILYPFITIFGISITDYNTIKSIVITMLLIFTWASTVNTICITTENLISLYLQQEVKSKSEIIKRNITKSSLTLRSTVFIPISVTTSLATAIILATHPYVSLKELFNSEILTFLSIFSLTPILGITIPLIATSFISTIAFSFTQPHRILSDKEAIKLLPPVFKMSEKKVRKEKKGKKPVISSLEENV
jgi:uncharacterized membrane protein